MAKFAVYTTAELESLAAEIGHVAPLFYEAGNDGELELGETIEVWTLDSLNIKESSSLRFKCINTNLLHHQIYLAGHVHGHARSLFVNGEPEFCSFQQGTLAARVDQAITWLDTLLGPDALVRLLTIPALYVVALWILDDEQDGFYLLDFPVEFDAFVSERVYDGSELIEVLQTQPSPTHMSERTE